MSNETVGYVIKIYQKLDNGGLKYIQTMPYVFPVEPINICNQLNLMLSEHWLHMISVNE